MGGERKAECKVVFQPEKTEVAVRKGSTVLEACSLAGIDIDAVCGGEGKCGRCKVRPIGEFKSAPSPLVSQDEKGAGIVLACLTTVEGDLTVEVMPRSRIGRHQILTRSTEEMPKVVSPWVRKEFVELPPATLSDNIADLERLYRGLGKKDLCIPLETMKTLPKAIRADRWRVTATLTELESTNEVTHIDPGNSADLLLGIAVDIGTTTVVVDLVDLITGKILGTASDYNRQTSRGEDVIARMMFAEEKGLTELKLLVRETINLLIKTLVKQESSRSGRRVTQGDIVAASIAGNTVMTHMLAGIDTRSIRLEPYVPVSFKMPCLKAAELGISINSAARVLLFPARAGYVGGDVLADVLASGMHRSDRFSMLIDVGTNGEIVLGGKDWMATCSCSAGPAFEGGEVSCGMRAMEGAIDKVRINDDLSTTYHVIGEGVPNGICGSGLIDLIAEMYSKGLIDRKARILDSASDRSVRSEVESRFVVEKRKKLGGYARSDLAVTDADLQNLLRTKAAIYGACSVLMKKTDVSWDRLSSIIIAGGFGYHLDIGRAILIGMFPDVQREKYRFIGNGALGGARLALISAQRRKEISDIFEKMTYIDLSTDKEFYDEFSSSLFIPHTDLSKFPSHPEQGGHTGGAR
jgi:uncharacterized 2Fe-2S/4Fe-4S cluster protein (DUF4445 family)